MNSWPLTITSSGHKKATLLVPRRSAFSAADVKRWVTKNKQQR